MIIGTFDIQDENEYISKEKEMDVQEFPKKILQVEIIFGLKIDFKKSTWIPAPFHAISVSF